MTSNLDTQLDFGDYIDINMHTNFERDHLPPIAFDLGDRGVITFPCQTSGRPESEAAVSIPHLGGLELLSHDLFLAKPNQCKILFAVKGEANSTGNGSKVNVEIISSPGSAYGVFLAYVDDRAEVLAAVERFIKNRLSI